MDTRTPVIFAISCAEVGGTQQSLIRLLEGLDRRAFPPFVLLGEDGPLRDTLAALGVRHEVAPHSFRSVAGVRHFVRTARRERARVLHLHAPRTLALAARAIGLVVIERVNVMRGPETGGFVEHPLVDRALLTLSHRVIVPSQALAAQLRTRGVPGQKVRCIPTGIRVPVAQRSALDLRAALDIPGDAFVVLCVGRLAPIKGQDVLIRAAAALSDVAKLVVVLAGDGRQRASLASLASHHRVDLRLLGDRHDVADLMRACDVYVQPSRSEAAGQAIVEAMLAGCAVIASRTGGITEVVTDDTGRLVSPDDPAALADAIRELAGAPALRRSFGDRARAFASSLPGPDAMCRATESLYTEALACR